MKTKLSYSNTGFSNELIFKALVSSPAPTSIYSGENMVIQFANQGMLKLWGKDASVVGKPLMEAIPELEGQPFLSILQEVWRSGETYFQSEAPAELIRDGIATISYFDYEYKAILGDNGETLCILNNALDVTSKREFLQKIHQKEEIEHALKQQMAATLEELTSANNELNNSLGLLAESRQHIRTIIEQAPVGIAMLQGPDHIIETANSEILKIWGRTELEVIGLAHKTARPELIGQPVNEWIKEVYKTGRQKINNEFLVKLYDKGGLREAIVNSIYQPIFSPEQEVTGVLVILEEVTDQILQRRDNEKDQQMLAMAIDAGALATFYYEPSTNFFSGNSLLKKWFGLSSDERIDLSIALEVIVSKDKERVISAINYAINESSDGHYFIEYEIHNKQDHQPRLLQAHGRVSYDSRGIPLSLNGTLRDITEQKRDEQKKDDFIAMVSHELKTPLTSLKGYLQLLQRNTKLSENQSVQIILEKSSKQIQKMNSMIHGFLNVSRLDSGKLIIDKLNFDLKEFFAELEEELSTSIHTHKLLFKPSASLLISADREKISQVILNLIGNAVKYSPMDSEITVSYALLQDHKVKVSVHDQGIGIKKEDQQYIFERYYRVTGAHTGSISGFGIGLYLCKEIIGLHNGQITVNSGETTGTIFSFILPLKTGDKANQLLIP
jgi:two-component system sensor histidine kinase VicK